VHFCEKGNGYLLKERKFIADILKYHEKINSRSQKSLKVASG
jgi:hypothetical protein